MMHKLDHLHSVRGARLTVLAASLGCSALAMAAAKPQVDLDALPPFEKASPQSSLLRHAGERAPVTVAWRQAVNVQDVLAVYPHPIIAGRVVLATSRGLLLSDDYCDTWRELPQARAADVGPITQVLFSKDKEDVFYLASRTRGVWVTRDSGQTFQQIGSKASGLASDQVLSLSFNAHDGGGRTLLAAHGDAALGLSRSLDGGKTWGKLFPNYYVYQVYTESGQGIFVLAATALERESLRLYLTPSLGDAWQEMARDVLCTGFAGPVFRDDWLMVATADRGILRIARQGGVVRNVAPAGIDEWASIGTTWGAHQDSQLVYAFEPTRLGLVLIDAASTTVREDDAGVVKTQYRVASDGLLRSAVVREGAHIRANADGTHFYGCINSLLYVGQRLQGPQPIRRLDVAPAVRPYDAKRDQQMFTELSAQFKAFREAPDLGPAADDLLKVFAKYQKPLASRFLTVTARVDTSAGVPKLVTADLSRFGFSPRVPLSAVAKGQYELRVPIDPARIARHGEDWRGHWPGKMAFTVTAVSESGALSSAVATFAISEVNSGFLSVLEGITMEKGKPTFLKEAPLGRRGGYLRGFATDPAGPWRVSFQRWGGEYDVSSYYAVALRLRSRAPSSQELFVQLRDQPAYDYPHTTEPLPLLKSGLVPEGKFTGELQRIVIPLKQLIGNSTDFQPTSLRGLLLSGEGGERVDYFLEQMQFCPSAESLGLEEAE